MSQDDVFVDTEGDAYWRRNRTHMERCPSGDACLRLLELYGIRPTSALEVGASNGYRMAALQQSYGCRAVAVEPSRDALQDGRNRFPEVEFYHGTVTQIPLWEQFELVIVNFVLHWVDRANLLRAVAELDRCLADGGFLLLGDFGAVGYTSVPYRHADGLYTFKQDYAGLFVASGLYHPVGMLGGAHGHGLDAGASERERTATWLLRKDLSAHYAERAVR